MDETGSAIKSVIVGDDEGFFSELLGDVVELPENQQGLRYDEETREFVNSLLFPDESHSVSAPAHPPPQPSVFKVMKRKLAEITANEETPVRKARALADAIRRAGNEKFQEINANKKLSDVADDTIIEILSGEVVDSTFGSMVVANCTYTALRSKKLERGKLMFPVRCFADGELEEKLSITPRVIFFEGMKKIDGSQNSFYSVRSIYDNSVSVSRLAEISRAKSVEELRILSRICSFADFAEGSVFVGTSVRQTIPLRESDSKTPAKTSVMSYECIVNGEKQSGEIFLPTRLHTEVKKNLPVVIVYNGNRKSTGKGRTYFDLSVVSADVRSILLPNECNQQS